MSWRLSKYVVGVFLRWLCVVFFALTVLILCVEFMELTRRAVGKQPALTSLLLFKMALYKTPSMIDAFLPFVSFFGALLGSWRLQKGTELIAMGALGVSISRIFLPIACVSLCVGLFNLTLLNPISAGLRERYETLNQRFFQHTKDYFALQSTGLWVRQKHSDGTFILKADKVNIYTRDLFHITAYVYDHKNTYVGRLDAQQAIIRAEGLRLLDGWKTMLNQTPEPFSIYELPMKISFTQIRQSLKPPQTLSFWETQSFIRLLEASGMSASEHHLHWQRLLASPLWLCAMTLLALACMCVVPHQSYLLKRLLWGLFGGFMLYFLRDVTQGMASAGTLPPLIAVWGPIALNFSLGMTFVLHTEGH